MKKSDNDGNLKIKALVYGDALWQSVAEYASECSWQTTGEFLSERMKSNGFSDWERVFVALENGNIAGFCDLSKTSNEFVDRYAPMLGFLFVGEACRGKRISEKLCLFVAEYAKSVGFDKIYLYSDHVNLYEKYGFVKIDEKQASWGAMQSIYARST
jgi:Predicted acetyltransferase